MTTKPALALLCFLAPLLAGAGPLEVYGTLTGKTVLRSSSLPALPDSIVSDLPADQTNAIAKIEAALREKGIAVVQDGPNFVRIFRTEARGSFTNAPLRGAELAALNGQETTERGGMIVFSSADLGQVLAIYAQLRHRTILRAATLYGPPVNLQTRGGLTLEEAVYALATVLALNDIAVVDDGVSFVQVVPMGQRAKVQTRSPKPEPGAALFDPKKVPSMGVSGFSKPLTETERIELELERLRIAFYKFIHVPAPHTPPALRLLELYATLAGRTAVPSKMFDGTSIWFHVDTPLTKDELLYAIQTTFTLQNLAIVPVDDHSIRLVHISEARGRRP